MGEAAVAFLLLVACNQDLTRCFDIPAIRYENPGQCRRAKPGVLHRHQLTMPPGWTVMGKCKLILKKQPGLGV